MFYCFCVSVSGTPLLVRSSSDSALGPPQMEDVNVGAMVNCTDTLMLLYLKAP